MPITLDRNNLRILDASDLVKLFDISYPTALRLIKQVGGVRIGKRFLVMEEAIEGLLSGKDTNAN